VLFFELRSTSGFGVLKSSLEQFLGRDVPSVELHDTSDQGAVVYVRKLEKGDNRIWNANLDKMAMTKSKTVNDIFPVRDDNDFATAISSYSYYYLDDSLLDSSDDEDEEKEIGNSKTVADFSENNNHSDSVDIDDNSNSDDSNSDDSNDTNNLLFLAATTLQTTH